MNKSYIKSISYALGIPIIVILIALFLPNKPIEGSLHYSIIDKIKLLENTTEPRIILVGGSNLSFGINSKEIQDKTGYNVVNTSIQGGYGMQFDISFVREHVRKNDIVILSPEYRNFYGSSVKGDKILFYVLFDTYPEAKKYISPLQWFYLSQFFPKYSIEKINGFFKHYLIPNQKIVENVVYLRESYNTYGDIDTHWDLKPSPFGSYKSPIGDFNSEAIELITNFEAECKAKGASFFITFPCLQKASYENMEPKIDLVYKKLKENHFKLLGYPKRYQVDDSLLFNTAYHLNKKGLDIRTSLLIEDFLNQQ